MITAPDGQTDAFATMGEPPFFIIFAIIRQVALRHHAQQFTMPNHKRTVVDTPIAAQRSAEHQHGRQGSRRIYDRFNLRFDRVEKRRLQMKVIESVRR